MSWAFDGTKLDLTLRDEEYPRLLTSYERDFEEDWNLQSFTAVLNVQTYDCCVESYIDLTYTLRLRAVES